MQQDAEECWSNILVSLREKLKVRRLPRPLLPTVLLHWGMHGCSGGSM